MNKEDQNFILYFCFYADIEEIKLPSVFKAVSYSANNLNTEIIDVISDNKNAQVITFVPHTSFKDSKRIFFYPRNLTLKKNLKFPVLNFKFFKLLTINFIALIVAIDFLFRNRGNKSLILSFNPDPYFILPIILFYLLGKKSICLIADIEFIKNKISGKTSFRNIVEMFSFKLHNVYFSFNKSNLIFIGSNKTFHEIPFPIVIEKNTSVNKAVRLNNKNIVFSGAISEIYSINELLSLSKKLPFGFKLHLYGKGDLVELVNNEMQHNDRLEYYGFVKHEESLKFQSEATFLIFIMQDKLHLRLSFPNKLIEYLHSGTPILVDSIKYIPDYLQEYLTIIETRSNDIQNQITKLLMPNNYNKLLIKAQKGKEYVQTNYSRIIFRKKFNEVLK